MPIPKHLVKLQPIRDPCQVGPVLIPDQSREVHVQAAWVVETGELEEDLKPGDLVVFVGWKQRQAPVRQYAPWESDYYFLHEDDIELVIEEW